VGNQVSRLGVSRGINDIRPLVTVDAPAVLTTSRDVRLVGINNNGMVAGGMFDLGFEVWIGEMLPIRDPG
jgi:hypothetical protein